MSRQVLRDFRLRCVIPYARRGALVSLATLVTRNEPKFSSTYVYKIYTLPNVGNRETKERFFVLNKGDFEYRKIVGNILLHFAARYFVPPLILVGENVEKMATGKNFILPEKNRLRLTTCLFSVLWLEPWKCKKGSHVTGNVSTHGKS